MDYTDRKRIDRCVDNISPMIDMCKLFQRLLTHKVFNEDDVNVPRWEHILDQQETVRDILLTIKTRGPHAFKNLVLSLRESGHDCVANVLEGKELLASNNNDSTSNNESATGESINRNWGDDWYISSEFTTTKQPLVVNVRPAMSFINDDSGLSSYYMKRKPHGYVLIITIIEYSGEDRRRAAEFDETNLKKLFKDMGFEVTVPDPLIILTGAEIKRIINEFSKRNFSSTDSCFVIISAHGNDSEYNGVMETEIHGVDYDSYGAEKVLCKDIIEMFTVENCTSLRGKPKVFIFQACRGKLKQRSYRIEADGINENIPVRNYSDILIAHSTLPGHKAYRDLYNGSWYIQILCEVFMRNAWKMHIRDLLQMVDAKLMEIKSEDNYAQTPTVKAIGFVKHLYLNPGLFDESAEFFAASTSK